MAKTCKNCGATLDDGATYCFECKHNPDEVWSPEKDEEMYQKENKNRKVKTVVGIVAAVVLAISLVFIISSCSFYRSYSISGNYASHTVGLTAKLTELKQTGKEVTLTFKANDDLPLDMILEFGSDIQIDDCTYKKVSGRFYERSFMFSDKSSSYCQKGDTFEVIFSAADSSYKVSRGKVHIPSEYS